MNKTKESFLKPIIDFIGEAPEAVDFLQDKVCSMCGQPFNKSKQVKELLEIISQSHEEYADWKIKECLPEKITQEDAIKVFGKEKGIFYKAVRNSLIDQILINKDKK